MNKKRLEEAVPRTDRWSSPAQVTTRVIIAFHTSETTCLFASVADHARVVPLG